MRWSSFKLNAWLISIAVILAGCSTLPTPSNATNGTTTIRWRTQPSSPVAQAAYQALAANVSQTLASRKIQVVYEPDLGENYSQRLEAELTANNAPDIFWIGGMDLAALVATGQVLDLKPLIDTDPDFTLADFYQQPIRELTRGTKLYGLPPDVSTLVVYYNADLFKAAGLATPKQLAEQGRWNWTTLLDSARRLTDPARGQYGVGWSNWWGPGWGYFISAAGGQLFDDTSTACALNTPETIAAATFARTFYAEKLRPNGGQATLENLFNAGRVGMMWSGRWTTPIVRRDARFTWDVAHMPSGKQNGDWLFWGAYLINARSADPDAAWQVLKQLTSVEAMSTTADLGLTIPARTNPALIERFLAATPPSNNQVFIAPIAHARPEAPLWNHNWSAYNTRIQGFWDHMIAGNITPAAFAKAACASTASRLRSPPTTTAGLLIPSHRSSQTHPNPL